MTRATTSSEAGKTGETVRTTRPALDVLDRDQDRLLYDGSVDERKLTFPSLRDGFDCYLDAVAWYQAAGIRTLGVVEEVLPPSNIMPEATAMEWLAGSSSEAEYERQRLVETMDQACEQAYRQFRDRAQERVRSESGEQSKQTYEEIDADDERNPLMRPAFRRLDQAQAVMLRQLWAGFESREAVSRWVRGLSTATNGNKPDDLMDSIVASKPLLEALCSPDDADATLTRYRFAVHTVLPAMLAGARTLSGSELPQTEPDSNPFNKVQE